MTLREEIECMFSRELSAHGRAYMNYEALKCVEKKYMEIDGLPVELHFNPARVASVMAKVDEETLRHRKCFLCPDGLEQMQLSYTWRAASGTDYFIRVNPFPIFDRHFTVSIARHVRQHILERYPDMLSLCRELEDYVVFYNGPMCGASAPDHQHFQTIPKGNLPIERLVRDSQRDGGEMRGGVRLVAEFEQGSLSLVEKYARGAVVVSSDSQEGMASLFQKLYGQGKISSASEWEPRVNLLSWYEGGRYYTVVYFRAESRPACFEEEDLQKRILISPASVEMSGIAIVSSRESFEKLTDDSLGEIIREVSLPVNQIENMCNSLKTNHRTQPDVSVGIMFVPEITAEFLTDYTFSGEKITGVESFKHVDGKVEWRGKCYESIQFDPVNYAESVFELKDVTIGINFHWERKENQRFQGGLRIIVENGKLTAVNLVGVEDYLISVISSEMSATATKEFLKAHAVISRSWLLAQMDKSEKLKTTDEEYSACIENDEMIIKWYDREDHTNFDVCADDHCQRYQGITRASTEKVREVINETWGQVLMYNGAICDARFSKSCGGVFEEFWACWEEAEHPYLQGVPDRKPFAPVPDLTVEENAVEWIMNSPEALCNTTDKEILSQALNNYDQETTDFYRWKVVYTPEELSALVKERSGIDFGDIVDLVPVKRGTSGRLYQLKIVGTKKTMIVGKELEIRKYLSKSHLYSSAFVPRKEDGKFVLYGAGWGHGVGLCQIGAAVMGAKGFKYDEILLHYFIDATIAKNY